MKGKLYIGLGTPKKDSYLLVYDLKEKILELLASSQRKEKESPFDDSTPTRYPWMTADSENDRILLYALKGRRENPTGLWSINPSDNKLKQLIHFNSGCNNASFTGMDKLLISDSFSTFTYDLNSRKTRLINSFHKMSPLTDLEFKDSGAGTFRDIGPKILVNNWLWSADYFGRISPDPKTQEVFNFHDGESLFKPKEFMQSVTIDSNLYILASSQQQLWMFKMSKGKNEKNK